MRAETVAALREYAVAKRRHEQRASFATDLEAERERRNGAGPTADPATSGAPVEKALSSEFSGGPQAPPTTAEVTKPPSPNGRPHTPDRAVDGARFILETPEQVPIVWGDEESVAWAQGEPLFIVGPAGLGKTTLGQRLALGRVGLLGGVLGMPVAIDPGRVLYIAADRPRQAARSFRRMVAESDREALTHSLVVWSGPLPFDIATDPERFVDFVIGFNVGTVVIDSLKDVALELSRDDVGSRVNNAIQRVIAEGVEVLVLHHQRKATADNSRPRSLSDVFGSTWLTAGAGSVVLLWGEAGDPIVELRHLKQPAAEVGPLKVSIDHEHGEVRIHEEVDLARLVAQATDGGLTAGDAAKAMFGVSEPSASDVEKARRKLDGLVRAGRATKLDAPGRGRPALYRPVDLRRQA